MKRNIKLLSTISVAAALAGSAIFVMNNNQRRQFNSSSCHQLHCLLAILEMLLLNGIRD